MALTQIPLSTLAGTSGTPVSETNKLIDDDDARMEKADTAVQPTGTPVANQLAYWTTAQMLAASTVTTTELESLTGIDGNVQAQLDAEASARSSGDALALKIASNLADLNSAATARDNLELGDSATKDVGTTAGSVAAGDDGRIVAGGTAVQPTRTVNGHALSADVVVTAGDVGLENCDNTSDANKPVSTAQAAAIALKAPLASPALTGVPTAPTAASGTNTTQLATCAFALYASPQTPACFTLVSYGDGTGVGTIQLYCYVSTTVSILGGGKFYSDDAGTIGESVSWTLAAGGNTFYVRVPSGKSLVTIAHGSFVYRYILTMNGANTPLVYMTFMDIPRNALWYRMMGNQSTISGDANDIPRCLTNLFCTSITGTIQQLPGSLTNVEIVGSSSGFTGDIQYMPAQCSSWRFLSSGAQTGNLATLPSYCLSLEVSGANQFTYNTVSGLHTFPDGMVKLSVTQTVNYLTAAMGDALLQDLDTSTTTYAVRTLIIPFRTAASDSYFTSLSSKGWTITATVV